MSQEPSVVKPPVEHVIDQLWGPALASPDVRLRVNPRRELGWTDVERYWMLPSVNSARLLVSQGPAAGVGRLLSNYRRLRDPRMNIARVALGALARTGAPLSLHTVALQQRDGTHSSAEALPLALVERALGGERLLAAIGVRTSDNRKATLQLAHTSGAPAGFAKFSWNTSTSMLVANESRVLSLLPSTRRAAAPQLLATLEHFGNPVCVTAPLPLDVRRLQQTDGLPAAQDFYDLLSPGRRDLVVGTLQFQRMRKRLAQAAEDPTVASVAGPASSLAARMSATTALLPVGALWHGDLTPWNAGRDSSGRFWVWDWEDAADDALAGLDSLHWCVATARLREGDSGGINLARSMEEAAPHLTALGVPRDARGVLAAVYALTVLDRACTFARDARTWANALIPRAGLLDLLGQASRLVDH